MRNLEILNATTDAKGRKVEVVKVHVPPPLFRTYKEAAGVHVRMQCPFRAHASCFLGWYLLSSCMRVLA